LANMGTAKPRAEKMAETRAKLILAARRAFATKGYAAASMDDLTADVGLTRGALYHNFGDKRGLLMAVVNEIDGEMATRAHATASKIKDPWGALVAECIAYIELALDPEIQRIVLLDGPAALGDPSMWPSQQKCVQATTESLGALIREGLVKRIDPEAAARLLNGAALNAALWIAASEHPNRTFTKATKAFKCFAEGLLQPVR